MRSPRTATRITSFLHDLSIQMTEAFTEYLHKRISGELGFAAEDRATPNRC